MPEVPVVDTSWSDPEEFARDVHAAFVQAGLSSQSAALLTAHVALSTGWGRKVHNYVLAGIKAVSESEPYVVLRGFEYVDGVKTEKTPMKWHAFGSLLEGAQGMISLLQKDRYASAWDLLTAGDPEYFAEVGRDGWYTAPVDSTAADMRARLTKIQKWLSLPATASVVTGGSLLLLLLAGLGYWYFFKRRRNR